MRWHNFFGKFDLSRKHLEIIESDFLHQVKNVLRLKKGNLIVLSDNRFNSAVARIAKISQSVMVEILKTRINQNEPKASAVLCCSILKKENFKFVAQKATEVGVKEITPIIAKNTVKLSVKTERLQKIIKEAAEQSSRGMVPILRETLNFKEALKSALLNDLNLFFHVEGAGFDSAGLAAGFAANPAPKIGIFIGPEGGWSEAEVRLAKANNFKIISLGKLTLRAETAAIVASYLVCQSIV